MIDLHSHILPGVDDGVRSLAEAEELARAAVACGVTAIAATPHVRDDYPTTPDRMEAGVEGVRHHLARAGVPVDVLVGGEVALDRLERLPAEDVVRFTLAGTGRYLLVEFPYYGWPFGLENQLRRLVGAGITPLLAHPERNPEVQAEPQRLERLLRMGVLAQVTIDSLAGRFGRRARRAAGALVDLELLHVLASDAHSPGSYSLSPAELANAVGNRRLARYLTVEAPAAIAAGEPMPTRPAV